MAHCPQLTLMCIWPASLAASGLAAIALVFSLLLLMLKFFLKRY